MLRYAEDALRHASRLWTTADDVNERIQAQWTFFPDGLDLVSKSPTANTDSGGLFRNPVSCLKIFALEGRSPQVGLVMGASGFEPLTPAV